MAIAQLVAFFVGMAALGLGVVAFLLAKIGAIRVSDQKAGKIAAAIQQGAMAFLREEYRLILVVVAFVAGLLGYLMDPTAAVIFVLGAFLSMTAVDQMEMVFHAIDGIRLELYSLIRRPSFFQYSGIRSFYPF